MSSTRSPESRPHRRSQRLYAVPDDRALSRLAVNTRPQHQVGAEQLTGNRRGYTVDDRIFYVTQRPQELLDSHRTHLVTTDVGDVRIPSAEQHPIPAISTWSPVRIQPSLSVNTAPVSASRDIADHAVGRTNEKLVAIDLELDAIIGRTLQKGGGESFLPIGNREAPAQLSGGVYMNQARCGKGRLSAAFTELRTKSAHTEQGSLRVSRDRMRSV